MNTSSLSVFSDAIADAIAAIAPAVVQVRGRRRPASGLVYADDVVVTTARALGREDELRVQTGDGRVLGADLAGWDPASSIAVLRVPGLGAPPAVRSAADPRVGHVALAVARSWSNALTASAGIVAVIGGPLRTGRRQSIDRVIRTTAPMHDGFAGGAVIDAGGQVIGLSTASAIRGFEVAIPAGIVWATAASVLQHGRPKRGFLGITGQPVRLSGRQRPSDQEHALLVSGITPDSPADAAGVLLGDLLLRFDGRAIQSAEDLLDLLGPDRIGSTVSLDLLRGGQPVAIAVTVGERQGS
jgi:serine protease DegQ